MNYRFSAESGIGGAARAVNAGDGRSAMRLFKDEGRHDIRWQDVTSPDR
jgi:hypothetical protein